MIKLKIITLQNVFLETTCKSVVLPTSLGEVQILPDHTNALFLIELGVITYDNINIIKIPVLEGWAEIIDNCVIVSVMDAGNQMVNSSFTSLVHKFIDD